MNKGAALFVSGLAVGIAATKGTEYVLSNPKVQEFIANAKKKFQKEVEETPEVVEEIQSVIIPVDEKTISTGFSFSTAEAIVEDVKEKVVDIVEDVKEDLEEKPSKKRGRKKKVEEPKLDKKKEGKKKKYDIPPYEISQSAFSSNEPSFEKVIIWYDDVTDTFRKNDGTIIEYNEAIDICGSDNVTSYLDDDAKRFLYIRNEQNGIDYEIIKE